MSTVYAQLTRSVADNLIKSSKLVSSTVMNNEPLPTIDSLSSAASAGNVKCRDYLETICTWMRYIAIDIWEQWGDPETNNYFWLKGGPWLTWLATISYLTIVLYIGPKFMEHRQPYNLKIIIRLYNLLLVYINAYLFVGTLMSFRYGLDYWGCSEALSLKKRTILLHYGHLFFHTRYLEFFDTFFFILRKKQSQITFLHVFHHGIVPTLMYIGMKFYPVPFNVLLPTTNMFVHIIMYAYYGLATFGPKIQKYLWWKKYLTRMQISQFALLIFHCSQPLYLSSCKFPTGLVLINTSIGLVFLMLFTSFYIETYSKQQNSKSKSAIVSCIADQCGVDNDQHHNNVSNNNLCAKGTSSLYSGRINSQARVQNQAKKSQ